MSEFEKLVVGLGNPGEEYEDTAHNLGFLVVDRLAERNGIKVSRKDCRALVGQGTVAGEASDARQAADVHESERRVGAGAVGEA